MKKLYNVKAVFHHSSGNDSSMAWQNCDETEAEAAVLHAYVLFKLHEDWVKLTLTVEEKA